MATALWGTHLHHQTMADLVYVRQVKEVHVAPLLIFYGVE